MLIYKTHPCFQSLSAKPTLNLWTLIAPRGSPCDAGGQRAREGHLHGEAGLRALITSWYVSVIKLENKG